VGKILRLFFDKHSEAWQSIHHNRIIQDDIRDYTLKQQQQPTSIYSEDNKGGQSGDKRASSPHYPDLRRIPQVTASAVPS
jgi:hypothetical protein